jgi:hypothetical protein
MMYFYVYLLKAIQSDRPLAGFLLPEIHHGINMLITTIYGEMEESLLEKREGIVDDDNEHTTWVEYWLNGEIVHRSAHVTLKRVASIIGEAGGFTS